MNKIPNIVLDIDDVIFDFQPGYAKKFNTKVQKSWSTSNLMKKRLNLLMKDKDFWIHLPIKNIPNFQPKGFVSARGIPKKWTIESLRLNNIPGRSKVNQVYWGESKISKLKELKTDIFIDDKYETFKECHANGIFCLLMNASHNQKYKTNLRVFDLNLENILKIYDEHRRNVHIGQKKDSNRSD